jgi:DNA polymerase III subunit delta
MRIDSEQLAQHISRDLAALYTIVGEEPLLALEAGDRLRARARELGYSERTLLVVESGFEWGSLAAAGASLSLFAERRLIELRIPNGKPGTAGAEALERYCTALAPDTVTVMHLPAIDWKAAQSAWFQTLDSAGVLIEARAVDRARLPRWLAGRLAQQQQSVDDPTLQFVADRVEGNLLAAWQEVQKLALLFPVGKLAFDDVRRAVLDVARFDIGNVSDTLLAGDAAHYVRVLDGLEAEGAALPLILWTLASDLRAAYSLVRALERGVPPANALREARVFGPRRAPMERAARRWSAGQLESALLRAATIDRMIKGIGRGQPWNELRELGLALMPSRAKPGARVQPRPPV